MKIDNEELMYEDDLPDKMTDGQYNEWYKTSKIVYGVRMGKIFKLDEEKNNE